jgi:hypothetical protein
MREFTILIPELRNSDSQPHGAERWQTFEANLLDIAGGFSRNHNLVRGCWRNSAGNTVRDNSVCFRVALPAPHFGPTTDLAFDKLVGLVKSACHTFDQQCIYFAETGIAELIEVIAFGEVFN